MRASVRAVFLCLNVHHHNEKHACVFQGKIKSFNTIINPNQRVFVWGFDWFCMFNEGDKRHFDDHQLVLIGEALCPSLVPSSEKEPLLCKQCLIALSPRQNTVFTRGMRCY